MYICIPGGPTCTFAAEESPHVHLQLRRFHMYICSLGGPTRTFAVSEGPHVHLQPRRAHMYICSPGGPTFVKWVKIQQFALCVYILIYAVVGRFAPYVGQLGGKTRRPRTPLRRLYEHAARSRNLARHFTGQCRRNLRTMGRIAGRASLPRTLARSGTHKASILPLQETTRQNIDAKEHLIEKILHPTLNGVTPYCGMRHIGWLYGDLSVPDRRPIQQLAAELLTRSTCTYTAPQLLHLLTECRP